MLHPGHDFLADDFQYANAILFSVKRLLYFAEGANSYCFLQNEIRYLRLFILFPHVHFAGAYGD